MDSPLPELTALEEAIAIYGSQSEMARARRVSQGSVWKWLHNARRLPAEHVLAVEVDTGVSRHRLRPDIYPTNLPTSQEVLANREGQGASDRRAELHRVAAA